MQEYLRPKNTSEKSVERGGRVGVFYRTDCFLCSQKIYICLVTGTHLEKGPAGKYSEIVTLVSLLESWDGR